jgi:hypothetical protein
MNRAASIDGVAFWVPYEPTELQDTELAGISQRVVSRPLSQLAARCAALLESGLVKNRLRGAYL